MGTRVNRVVAAAFIVVQSSYLFQIVGRGGFGWDDVALREWGYLNLEIVLTAIRSRSLSVAANAPAGRLLEHFDRDKGAWFDIAIAAAESRIGQADLISGLIIRQQATVVVWAIGAALMFGTLYKAFGEVLALWGTLLYGSMPYLVGNALVNSKDTVFMVLYLLGVRTLLFALEAKTRRALLIHGICLGLLVATRSIGLVLVGISLLILLRSEATAARVSLIKQRVAAASLVALAASVSTVLLWPAMWFAPLRILWYSMSKNAFYPTQGTLLYFGELVPADQLPWHYPLVWIALTSPTLWVVLLILGLIAAARQTVQHVFPTRRHPNFVAPQSVVFIAYVFPLVSVISLGSTLYDGWRHLLFLAPGIIAFILAGISECARISARLRNDKTDVSSTVLGSIAAIAVLSGMLGIFSSHPYPSVYKNVLLFDTLHFEDDYWALSTMELVNHAVAQSHQTSERELRIYPAVLMPTYRLARYAATDVDGVRFVDAIEDADFVMTTFRSSLDRDVHVNQISLNGTVVHEVRAQNRVIGLLIRRNN